MLSFISSSAAIGLILALQAQGHAIITPALGGGTARSDVKRPTANAPCGAGVDVASLVATSQAIPVTNGAIAATITNFNPGLDGSRQVSAQIDPTGTGNSFQAATVSTNGDRFPLDISSQPIVVQVPAGLQSTSGTMLISFTTASRRFGNCVVASTGASNSTTTSTGTGTGTTSTGTGTGNTTTTGTGTGTGTGTTTTGAAADAQGAAAQGAAPAAGNPATGPLAGLKAKLQKIKASKAAQKNKLRDAVFHA